MTILRPPLAPSQISSDPSDLAEYGRDWTKHLQPRPSLIVFPQSTADVVSLVQWARQHKIALVPSGGRTGLSGAAFATQGEVVVSFQKMNKILRWNEFDMTVTCQPGVITESLQQFALEKGLYFPVDFASRGSSQIGGNIATNAGGIKVLRYGLMRSWVAHLEVVTGTGDVLKLGKSLVKNATGYDLRHLFIGSEGTLGFISQADIWLTKKPAESLVFLLAIPQLNAVMRVYHLFKKSMPILAFEMFTQKALDVVTSHTGLASPFQNASPFYVVLEIEANHSEVTEHALSVFEQGLQQQIISDGLLAQSPQQAREFWRFREDISESTAAHQPYKNDISVAISAVPEFLAEVDQLLKKNYPDFQVVWFGHIGDGNLHINILKPPSLSDQEFIQRCHVVNDLLFSVIDRFGGSISAEHGVGLTKKPYLHHSRSLTEIQIMKDIKKIFDPDHILNPGKIFEKEK